MGSLLRLSTCVGMLLLAHCASSVTEMGETSQALASNQNGDDANCGSDGFCNISQCTNDPDCSGTANHSSGHSVTWSLTGSTTPTDISGFAGSDIFHLGDADSTTHGVYALLSRERSDDPCFFAIGTEDLNDATRDTAPEVDRCGEKGPKSDYLHADYLDVDAGGSGDHNFVSGVSVCMNSAGDKVKGIDVVGKQLTSSGTLVGLAMFGSPPRIHCSEWESWVQCPTGQIATAVDAHFSGGNTFESLTGIALQCRALTVE
jgi:hypothetical protein